MEYKVLSLDIWDTVLRRKCHPDEIKLATARYMYFTYYSKLKTDYQNIQRLLSARIAAEKTIANQHSPEQDDEYKIRDVFTTMLRNVFIDAGDVTHVVESLYDYELSKEADMVYLDPDIVDTIAKLKFEKLGYISDFYAGEDFLDTLLAKAGFPCTISFKYVSCDRMLNKRSGRLYEAALEELQIKPGEQLHLGDNKYSDFSVPQGLGINAELYAPAEEGAKRKAREAMYSVASGLDLNGVLDKMYSNREMDTELAPFFMTFVLWILEDCVKRGIKKVYYFTREGEFFSQIHRVIERSGLFSADVLPHAEILEVSRVSTFATSLREITIQEMMRLWNQYSIQSMHAFGKSLALDDEALVPWLERYGIELNEIITYPWQDDRVQALFRDAAFVATLQKHIDMLRDLAEAYFAEKGITKESSETFAIVDIGWRGSIQDNISLMYPNHRFIGYYLALEQFLNEQPFNSEKYGYLNGLPNYQYLLRIVAPIEMLCNSPNGSTLGYQRMPDGHMAAIRKKERGEESIFEEYTSKIQARIIEKAAENCELMNIHSICADQLREETYNRFSEILLTPDRRGKLTKYFFRLKHNEEFGVGGFVDKHARLRLDLMIKAFFVKSKRRELVDFLNNTSWPQGYLVKYHLDPLVRIFNGKLGIR